MNYILIELERKGIDIDSALERMMGDVDFYVECLVAACQHDAFRSLDKALNCRDTNEAIDSAHQLKGLLLNLGLEEMGNCCAQIVTLLRQGIMEQIDTSYKHLVELNKELTKLLGL